MGKVPDRADRISRDAVNPRSGRKPIGVLFVIGVGVLGVCIDKVCRPQESKSGGVSEGELQYTQAAEPERAYTPRT